MSEARDILAGVVSERQTWSAENCLNLRTCKAFTAEVEEQPDVELNESLGRDARESILIHIQDRDAASDANMQINDHLIVTLYGIPVKLKVLRRKDNPASPQVEFGCMKIVVGKDA